MGHTFYNFTTILIIRVMHIPLNIREKARKIKWLVTDCDGVLTDTGVYYTAEGEYMKRFSIRDGMGVERIREETDVDVAIMTGENTGALMQRADRLKITELYLQITNKVGCMEKFLVKHNVSAGEIAYIGDDHNDLGVLEMVGLSVCPSDAMEAVKGLCDWVCQERGGYGAFREIAEIIIQSRSPQ